MRFPERIELVREAPPPFPRLPHTPGGGTTATEGARSSTVAPTSRTATPTVATTHTATAPMRSAVVTATHLPPPVPPPAAPPVPAPAPAPVVAAKGKGKFIAVVAAAAAVVVAVVAAVSFHRPKPAPKPEVRIQELVFAGAIEPGNASILVNGKPVELDGNKAVRIEPGLDPRATLTVTVSPPPGYDGVPVPVAPADPKPDATGRLVINRDVRFARRTVQVLAFIGAISPPNALVHVNGQPPVPLANGECKLATPLPYGEALEVGIFPPPGYAGKPVSVSVRDPKPGEDGRVTVGTTVKFMRATGSLTVLGKQDHTHAEVNWVGPLSAERESIELAGDKAPGLRQEAFVQNKAVFDALPTGIYKITLRSPDNSKAVPARPLPQEWQVAAGRNQEVRAPRGWSGSWQARYVFTDKSPKGEFNYDVACLLVFDPGLAGGTMTETFTRQGDNQLVNKVQCPITDIFVDKDGSLRAKIQSEKGPGTFDDALQICQNPGSPAGFRMVRLPDPKYGGKYDPYRVDTPVSRAD